MTIDDFGLVHRGRSEDRTGPAGQETVAGDRHTGLEARHIRGQKLPVFRSRRESPGQVTGDMEGFSTACAAQESRDASCHGPG